MALATLERVRINPIAIFKPLEWQIEPWLYKGPVMLLTGGAGGGKSRIASEKLHGFCKKYPKAQALVIRNTRTSMTGGTIPFLKYKVIGDDPQVQHLKSEFHFAYSNGSRLAYIGMDGEEDRKKLRSFGIDGGIDIAWIEEAVETEYEDYNEIRGRMRGKAAPWRQLILTTNPDSDLHWINVHLIEGGKAKVFYSQSADNPYNPDDYNATLAEMTGVRALRMREGKWARATGLVYDMWLDDYGKAPAGQEQGNVTEQAEYVPDRNLTFFWGVDDGYVGTVDQLTGHFTGNSHPRVFLLGQVRADGRVSIFAEHYAIKRLSEEHISEVQTLAKENSWPDEPDFAVVDKSAAELKGRLNSKGIATRNGAPTVEESIKMLQNLIAPDSNGVRQLMIHPRCKHLRSEMNAYRRDPLTEKPVKEFDHGPDVCRYLAYSLRAFGVN